MASRPFAVLAPHPHRAVLAQCRTAVDECGDADDALQRRHRRRLSPLRRQAHDPSRQKAEIVPAPYVYPAVLAQHHAGPCVGHCHRAALGNAGNRGKLFDELDAGSVPHTRYWLRPWHMTVPSGAMTRLWLLELATRTSSAHAGAASRRKAEASVRISSRRIRSGSHVRGHREESARSWPIAGAIPRAEKSPMVRLAVLGPRWNALRPGGH